MQNIKKIERRPNISGELADTLRAMIFGGDLSEGERINEVQLAAKLGVSRTPLREALTTLAAEKALESIPRRGFFVLQLTVREFEDIYPIRSFLDPEGLRLSGIPSHQQLRKLENIDKKMRKTRDYKTRARLDDQWHLELIANCNNRVLIGQIKLFMRRIRRYDLAFHRDHQVVEVSQTEHRKIISALKEGDIEKACEWLKKNLTSDKATILEWLEERKKR